MKLKTFCIICTRRIPLKRQRRNAITCSAAHQKLLVKLRKEERDRRICQQCGRPCTENETGNLSVTVLLLRAAP